MRKASPVHSIMIAGALFAAGLSATTVLAQAPGETAPAAATQAPAPQTPAAPAPQAVTPSAPVAAPAPVQAETPTQAPAVAPAPVETVSPDAAAAAPAPGAAGNEPAMRADIPHDLSPVGMFLAADWVVKSVMIALALASVATWTVWLAKSLELVVARRSAMTVIRAIRHARSLGGAVENIGKQRGPAAFMLRAAAEEVRLSEGALDHSGGEGLKERVSSVLRRIEAHGGRRMMRGTGILATTGSIAPFVGLFGTVWGIMNSFIGISESQTTNLAVVAPGIAEALLATAIGLVAAIPAVVIYNIFSRSITGYRQLLADAAAGTERLVSRDLDYRKAPPSQGRGAVSLAAE